MTAAPIDTEPVAIRPTGYAVWLVLAGVVGWWAAFQLTVEKFVLLADPDATAGCDFSILVQCTANLESWQGSVFGFPNPILGLSGWVAPIVVGVAVLSGARFPRWFWALFGVGILLAQVFVIWLISQSIFVLGTLCPWCMVTWAVTIPTFVATLFHLLRNGTIPLPERARERAESLMGWTPLFAVAGYAIIAILAQVRLDAVNNIFGHLG